MKKNYEVTGFEYYDYSGFPREARGVRCLVDRKCHGTREEAEAALYALEKEVKSKYAVKSSFKKTDEETGETKIAIITNDGNEIFLRVVPVYVKDSQKVCVLTTINGDGLHTQAFATREDALKALRNTLVEEAEGYYKAIGAENTADYDAVLKELNENGFVFPQFTADEYYLKQVEVQ